MSLHLRRAWFCHGVWGRPSVFKLQALLIIVRYRIETGEFCYCFCRFITDVLTVISDLRIVFRCLFRCIFCHLIQLNDKN
ncbi:hypothetical protein GGS21DRAFT_434316 [Xylaria nigripes]|nr:hypothetical protein GGS21DRAFT_434316 [Xylaria nigripes]